MDAPALQYATTPDGFSLAYTVCGEGPPLLYLPHPSCHTHLYWRSRNVFSLLYQHLASRFRLICYDGRGQGSSTRGLPPSYRLEDQYTDLETIIEHIGLRSVTLLGHNNSAHPALRYAVDHPDRVVAVVLRHAFAGDPAVDGWEPSQTEALAASNWELYIEVQTRMAWMMSDPETARRLVSEAMTQHDTLVFLRSLRDYTLESVIDRVRTPTLLLASSRRSYPFASEAAGKYIASRIEGAQVEVYDDDGGGGLLQLSSEVPPGVLRSEEFVRQAMATTAAEDPEPILQTLT